MGVVLGSLAIVISFSALWFTVEAVRRVDVHGDGMVRPHVRALKSRIAETNARMSELDRRLTQLEDRIVTTRMESRAARDLAEETRSIRSGLQRSRAAMKGTQAYHA
ncbi:MAG: hypothetical protein HOB37_15975 [Rhodospirillaceae bacterium]|nr:hypothetical protein [Rhodospirillaceae bacterium]MBT5298478.1 hypothetical protein [Rhodospirillaceae bacterium]MBT5514617.1 hypothetical protein [Rhodospirillaceae bacterium]MBT6609934.1 hypothetical protein [Rhodospirillaceae bacterium]MBT6886004.1 hypothetical protein [Rhodospirillaceae bacterium]